MKMRDSGEVRPPSGDLESLVARIHEDLRKERKARVWRDGAPDRRKTVIALLVFLLPLALAIYLATII